MQKGDFVICIADVSDHTWYAGCNCPTCKPNRKKITGPNKDEVVTVSGTDSEGITLVEYPDAASIGFFLMKDFKKLPPMDVKQLVEDCITELTI